MCDYFHSIYTCFHSLSTHGGRYHKYLAYVACLKKNTIKVIWHPWISGLLAWYAVWTVCSYWLAKNSDTLFLSTRLCMRCIVLCNFLIEQKCVANCYVVYVLLKMAIRGTRWIQVLPNVSLEQTPSADMWGPHPPVVCIICLIYTGHKHVRFEQY